MVGIELLSGVWSVGLVIRKCRAGVMGVEVEKMRALDADEVVGC
jgi:hypothetical protein